MDIFKNVREFQNKIKEFGSAPSECEIPSSCEVINKTLYKDCYISYIKKICYQINGSYTHGWNDACSVMIRRLVETLIIELYEVYKIQHKIKRNGDYLFLKDLISIINVETEFSIGRHVKTALKELKDIGDKSAHSRRYIAFKDDIDKHKKQLRDVFQELWTMIEEKNKLVHS
jgi:hypothetical protein